jgi:hypothetical protein
VVPRPMPAAPRRNRIAVGRSLPAAPLVVRRRYLIVAPKLLPAAPRRRGAAALRLYRGRRITTRQMRS